ncbi:hypothetical protein [Algoriphagus sp. A40]|uniref:hypothetical protein n=1 Tax=Algoriphagus sp. A40 TaxID=1945863 RepID=UPI00098658CE|nr:hypothetical protein [Algoriphagus sp. A40]OOG77649.1 hypothetical protein B0E43_04440 [Algoriphagus sp. A40]
MRLFILAFKSCPKFLNWLFLISLIGLTVKFLWLDSIPEFFPKAGELGIFINNILIANIAGYLFYVLSTEIPRVVGKRNNANEIVRWAEGAANGVTGFLQMAYYSNSVHHPTLPSILDIDSVELALVEREFTWINPTALAPMSGGFKGGNLGPTYNWLEAMAAHEAQCMEYIAKLWRISSFLESELSSKLLQLENSRHSSSMKSAREIQIPIIQKGGTLQNQDLSTWTDNYYESYKIAREIMLYCDRYRKNYVE